MEANLLTSLSDNIRIDRDRCTGCGRCVEVCILDNLRLQLSPCRRACPVGMNCQGYLRQLARGELDKGANTVREAAPLAGVLGRVCSRPCETACNRLKVDGQAVSIRDVKRFLTDHEDAYAAPFPAVELPGRVAVVGAGPAGLTAAYYLRADGFRVTLFDREAEPGGLLRWAIPEFRLPKAVLDRELRFLGTSGIEFRGSNALGKDMQLDDLIAGFDAVLIAVGAHREMRLGIPGEDAPEVIPALTFMKRVREGVTPELGKDVVVIGGGNAAIDAAQAARRAGAARVTVVSLEPREEMPAFRWGITEAEEEGVFVVNGWGPKSFRFEGNRLAGVTFRKCTGLFDGSGAFSPSYDESTTMDLPCDTVMVAIGQGIDAASVNSAWSRNGGVDCDPVTLQTENPKVFVAGDFVTGPRTVVEAMAQGKEAAISIGRMLKDEDLWYERMEGKPCEFEFEPDWSRAVKRDRVIPNVLPPAQRTGLEETVRGLSSSEAVAEAERCLNCGKPFGLRTCWFCLPCEIECPEEALYVEIPYLLR